MGKTAYSGPVFGAKGTLACVRVADISSGGGNGLSTNVGAFVVPTYEDWYATELLYQRASTGSTGLQVSVGFNSTALASTTINSSLAERNGYITITPDPGEYQGARIPGGSTVTFNVVQSSVAPPSSGVTLTLRGYTRFINSSSYEG